jgi:hypothetical protein
MTMPTRFTVTPDVYSSSDKDGSTILSVERGVLYSVMGVGSLIWNTLYTHPNGLNLDDIVRSIHAQFKDIPERQIKADAEKLLNQLSQKGIVEISDGEHDRIVRGSERWFGTAFELLLCTTVNILLWLGLRLIAVFIALVWVDLSLKLGGFRTLHGVVKRWPVSKIKRALPELEQGVCKAVDQAATYYPRHVLCLQRSAAITCLLRSCGMPAQMVIGVRRIPFKGHAWVEVNGAVVNDNQKVQTICSNVLERC